MTIGSLFAGIGGLELGLEWAGLGPTIWQVEINGHCRRVLEQHWPYARRYEDVRDVGAHNLEVPDVVCGGFPCQDVSGAGQGAGLAGSRSGLWYEFRRIIQELRPTWAVVENVASGAVRWIDPVCGQLERLGYECLPIPLAAADVGAPHLRRRIFIVAHAANAERLVLRHERQRLSGGRSGGVRPSGNAQPRDDGDSSAVADADGSREQCSQEGAAERRAIRRRITDSGESGADALCQRCDGGTCLQEAAGPPGRDAPQGGHSWWATEPAVGRVAHGIPNRVAELRALGNSVVPQCAQVVGEVIRLLEVG